MLEITQSCGGAGGIFIMLLLVAMVLYIGSRWDHIYIRVIKGGN